MPSSFVSEAIFILFGATSQGLYQVQMRFMPILSTHTASRLSFTAHSLYLNTADLIRGADGLSSDSTTHHLPKAKADSNESGAGAGHHHWSPAPSDATYTTGRSGGPQAAPHATPARWRSRPYKSTPRPGLSFRRPPPCAAHRATEQAGASESVVGACIRTLYSTRAPAR